MPQEIIVMRMEMRRIMLGSTDKNVIQIYGGIFICICIYVASYHLTNVSLNGILSGGLYDYLATSLV